MTSSVDNVFILPSDLVFYDGECGLCNQTVQWILCHDRDELFTFCPLQSGLAEELLAQSGVIINLDTVYYMANETLYERSDATLEILQRLYPCFAPLFIILKAIPKWMRNGYYNFISDHRHFLGKPRCILMSSKWKRRFLS